MKHSKLLKFLLAPFFMFAIDDEGGAAEDRGDVVLADGAPDDGSEIVDPIKGDKAAKDDKAAEADPDADPEADPDAVADPKDPAGKKDTRIPLARHKEMLEKGRLEREALVAQLAQFQKGAQVAEIGISIDATEVKLVALETEYTKLLADGEIDKATAKMTEIRRMERTIGDQKSALASQAAETRAYERVRYDTVVERIESAYTVMNPDSPDFDKESVAEVLDLKAAYESRGMTPSAALQKAVKTILGAESGKEKTATEVTPVVKAADAAAARKEATLKRNIDAANKTPASTAKVGLNSDEAGGVLTGAMAMAMPQDEFAKLDEKSLAKLRGDTL
jgi:hypothetical protein